MQVPQLKEEFFKQAEKQLSMMTPLVKIINKALELQYAAEQSQEQYITAEEARKLGAGNAEYRYREALCSWKWQEWIVCGNVFEESTSTWEVQYRAIKQAQPEPKVATVLRSDFDYCMQDKQRCVKLIEDVYGLVCDNKMSDAKAMIEKRVNNRAVNIPPFIEREPSDPHAALRAEYAKQVKEGTTGFYLWEWQYKGGVWQKGNEGVGFKSDYKYRYTDISCCVSKDGEPAIRMLRTEAQELQRKLGDTVDWYFDNGIKVDKNYTFQFNTIGEIYTYRPKTTIKLDGKTWHTPLSNMRQMKEK